MADSNEENLFYEIERVEEFKHYLRVKVTYIGKNVRTFEYYFVDDSGIPHYFANDEFIEYEECGDSSYIIKNAADSIKLSRDFVEKTYAECRYFFEYDRSEDAEDYVEFNEDDEELKKIADGYGCLINFDFNIEEAAVESSATCKLIVTKGRIELTMFSDYELETCGYSGTLNNNVGGWHIRGDPGDFILSNNQMKYLCREIRELVDDLLNISGIYVDEMRRIYKYYKKIPGQMSAIIVDDDKDFESLFK